VIRIYRDAEAMSRAAAESFAGWAGEAVAARGNYIVALAGGHTPRRVYEFLSEDPLRERVEWQRVEVFWGDERCVPPDDELSNERMARRAMLDRVPLPEANLHPVRCQASPARAAKRYEMFIRECFGSGEPRFDRIMLGLGKNGHTASLFPGSPALKEKKRLVVETTAPGEDFARVTMTASLINLARRVMFMVSGSDKAGILKRVLEGERDPAGLPAQMVSLERGKALWMVDRAAGRLLASVLNTSEGTGEKA
jgi:6-phosphogluconolactonase